MTVKDVLEVVSPGAEVHPFYTEPTKWVLCEKKWNSYDEASILKSFNNYLEKREKAHMRAMSKGADSDGYALASINPLGSKVVLNKNVRYLEELLSMEVARIDSRGSQGGASSVMIYVKDIYIVSVL